MRTSWEDLLDRIDRCEACALHANRTRAVPGEGDPRARLMFIGEGPGATEDELGRPFVGAAGALLTKMIEAAGMRREETYIANVVKCRPPGNRAPLQEETDACLPYLREQFALVRPRVIMLLGATAVQAVLGSEYRVTRDRGRFIERRGVFFMPTFHPAALLRDETKKRPAWEDFCAVRERLNLLRSV
ncbi:MAG: uracil-DNA glycosylase [Oscillospiraceae bacterium]|jgi:DNA polymerase|nr:uracil-DNA glycosylase [Oscillospiraceae bacterium]